MVYVKNFNHIKFFCKGKNGINKNLLCALCCLWNVLCAWYNKKEEGTQFNIRYFTRSYKPKAHNNERLVEEETSVYYDKSGLFKNVYIKVRGIVQDLSMKNLYTMTTATCSPNIYHNQGK